MLTAQFLTLMRGAGAVGTTPIECKRVTAQQLLDIHEVHFLRLQRVDCTANLRIVIAWKI